jgi:hypothetical protein
MIWISPCLLTTPPAYRPSISKSLTVLSWSAETDVLQASREALHHLKSRKYNYPTKASDFKRALNELESSFVKISDQKVSFLNPSIRDFMQSLFQSNGDYARDVIDAARRL